MSVDVIFRDLGVIDYKEAWDYQETLFKENIEIKIAQRKNQTTESTINHLLFCEHPHVFTLGKSGKPSHLLLTENQLEEHDATYYKINRGGDITYHGPGQIVAYPIFDLESYFFTDIHKYMRFLEEAVILTLADFGVESGRVKGRTGVWVGIEKGNERKICAMGVKASRWITMHGLAFNINADLNYFKYIIPCGIEDKGVTSLEKELGYSVEMDEVKSILQSHIASVFNFKYVQE